MSRSGRSRRSMTIHILDCGIGNVGAIASMYRRLGVPTELMDAPRKIQTGDKLILPGVGAFDAGARALRDRDFGDFLRDAAAAGHPLLGICLGMQLLCRRSEEGDLPGLGIVPADVVRLDPGPEAVRIPHMGWNIATPVQANPLLPLGGEDQRFYFTHTYRVRCDSDQNVLATTAYGTVFPSAIVAGNVLGVQFHPEKSHQFGKALLGRFAELVPADA